MRPTGASPPACPRATRCVSRPSVTRRNWSSSTGSDAGAVFVDYTAQRDQGTYATRRAIISPTVLEGVKYLIGGRLKEARRHLDLAQGSSRCSHSRAGVGGNKARDRTAMARSDDFFARFDCSYQLSVEPAVISGHLHQGCAAHAVAVLFHSVPTSIQFAP